MARVACICKERKKRDPSKREWMVILHKSIWNKDGKIVPSKYSTILCNNCDDQWETKAKYVPLLTYTPPIDVPEEALIDDTEIKVPEVLDVGVPYQYQEPIVEVPEEVLIDLGINAIDPANQ